MVSASLLFYRLSELMPFIGDQGWFYLSARDMLIFGKIPLVGITSSHIWLHQGPLWTYLLAGSLWIGHFNPIAGGYLSTFIGLLTVGFMYKLGSEVFSQRVGLIASFLYATSPLIIFSARMPYHTSPIPLLTLLLLYFIYRWINGYPYSFSAIFLLLALLYNFETATFMLVPIVFLVFIYGVVKKTQWIKNIINIKIILLSLLGLLIPMIPMLLYDIHHGYPQTVKFAVWIAYKVATIFGLPKIHSGELSVSYQSMAFFASTLLQRLLFLPNAIVAWSLLGISVINLIFIIQKHFKKYMFVQSYSLLLLFFLIPATSYIFERTNSDAYILVFYPTVIFMLALFFDRLMSLQKFYYLIMTLLLCFVFINVFTLFQSNFFVGYPGYSYSFSQRIVKVKQILGESKGQEYNIVGKGAGSQFTSFTMNYAYLAWWFGHEPSRDQKKLQFIIREDQGSIQVIKRIKK